MEHTKKQPTKGSVRLSSMNDQSTNRTSEPSRKRAKVSQATPCTMESVVQSACAPELRSRSGLGLRLRLGLGIRLGLGLGLGLGMGIALGLVRVGAVVRGGVVEGRLDPELLLAPMIEPG